MRLVSLASRPTNGPDPGLDAHYCDICADDQSATQTKYLAWFAATGLVVLGVTTAMALSLGKRDLPFQIAVVVVTGAVLPLALKIARLWRPIAPPILVESRDGAGTLVAKTEVFAKALRAHGFEELPEASPQASPFPRRHKTTLSLIGIGLLWLFLIQSLGGANVRVFVSGKEKAFLLVDTRHTGKVAPTNAEDPRAGQALRILGGRRSLRLISESGEELAQATRTIWPGRTYIVGQLPQGECLFWERRKYGKEGSRSLLFPLPGEGPVWELRDSVDSWFIPLDEGRAQSNPSDTDDWETSGGVRRAIRLLPCRAPSVP